MSVFDELNASLEEALDIKRGKVKPGRVTRHDVTDVKAILTEWGQTPVHFTGQNDTGSDPTG